MIRRMVTQMVIARLIPMALKAGKKAFRKKEPVANKSAEQNANIDDVTDTSQ